MPADASVVALVPVGPGEAELARVDDLLDSVVSLEPKVTSVVLVDDPGTADAGPRRLDRRYERLPLEVHAFLHPRRGRGSGVWGGLTQGVITALGYIHRHCRERIVLRLDGDSLVIAPFADRLARAFEAQPDIGLLGNVTRNPDGSLRRFLPWNRIVSHLTHLYGRCRGDEVGNLYRGRYFQTLIGRGRRVRRRIEQAEAAGYAQGEHAQGGGYAVRREVLEVMARHRCFADAEAYRSFFFSEDVAVGMYVRLTGYRLENFTDTGQVFGVAYRGLPLRPERLVADGYGVVHSLKMDDLPENELRSYFRGLRSPIPPRNRTLDEGGTALNRALEGR